MNSTGLSKYTHYIDRNQNKKLDKAEVKLIKVSTDQEEVLMLDDPNKTLIRVSDEIRYYIDQSDIQNIGTSTADDIHKIINEDAEALFR